jgi:hypothetical protein
MSQLPPFPFKVGDRVRHMRMFNGTCGQLSTITRIEPAEHADYIVYFLLDDYIGRDPTFWSFRLRIFTPLVECDIVPEHTQCKLTREVNRILWEAIDRHPEIKQGAWDFVDTVCSLHHETEISHHNLILLLSQAVDEGRIPLAKTVYYGTGNYFQDEYDKAQTPRDKRMALRALKRFVG